MTRGIDIMAAFGAIPCVAIYTNLQLREDEDENIFTQLMVLSLSFIEIGFLLPLLSLFSFPSLFFRLDDEWFVLASIHRSHWFLDVPPLTHNRFWYTYHRKERKYLNEKGKDILYSVIPRKGIRENERITSKGNLPHSFSLQSLRSYIQSLRSVSTPLLLQSAAAENVIATNQHGAPAWDFPSQWPLLNLACG